MFDNEREKEYSGTNLWRLCKVSGSDPGLRILDEINPKPGSEFREKSAFASRSKLKEKPDSDLNLTIKKQNRSGSDQIRFTPNFCPKIQSQYKRYYI